MPAPPLTLLLDPDPARIKADPNQIEQVLVNLVVNARGAMPEGGEVVISTQNLRLDEGHVEQGIPVPAGDYVQLLVEDNGDGMERKWPPGPSSPSSPPKPSASVPG